MVRKKQTARVTAVDRLEREIKKNSPSNEAITNDFQEIADQMLTIPPRLFEELTIDQKRDYLRIRIQSLIDRIEDEGMQIDISKGLLQGDLSEELRDATTKGIKSSKGNIKKYNKMMDDFSKQLEPFMEDSLRSDSESWDGDDGVEIHLGATPPRNEPPPPPPERPAGLIPRVIEEELEGRDDNGEEEYKTTPECSEAGKSLRACRTIKFWFYQRLRLRALELEEEVSSEERRGDVGGKAPRSRIGGKAPRSSSEIVDDRIQRMEADRIRKRKAAEVIKERTRRKERKHARARR